MTTGVDPFPHTIEFRIQLGSRLSQRTPPAVAELLPAIEQLTICKEAPVVEIAPPDTVPLLAANPQFENEFKFPWPELPAKNAAPPCDAELPPKKVLVASIMPPSPSTQTAPPGPFTAVLFVN